MVTFGDLATEFALSDIVLGVAVAFVGVTIAESDDFWKKYGIGVWGAFSWISLIIVRADPTDSVSAVAVLVVGLLALLIGLFIAELEFIIWVVIFSLSIIALTFYALSIGFFTWLYAGWTFDEAFIFGFILLVMVLSSPKWLYALATEFQEEFRIGVLQAGAALSLWFGVIVFGTVGLLPLALIVGVPVGGLVFQRLVLENYDFGTTHKPVASPGILGSTTQQTGLSWRQGSQMLSFCSECGRPMQLDDQFCTECGTESGA